MLYNGCWESSVTDYWKTFHLSPLTLYEVNMSPGFPNREKNPKLSFNKLPNWKTNLLFSPPVGVVFRLWHSESIGNLTSRQFFLYTFQQSACGGLLTTAGQPVGSHAPRCEPEVEGWGWSSSHWCRSLFSAGCSPAPSSSCCFPSRKMEWSNKKKKMKELGHPCSVKSVSDWCSRYG